MSATSSGASRPEPPSGPKLPLCELAQYLPAPLSFTNSKPIPSSMADPLNLRLRTLIVETLQLDDVDVSALDDNAPLIGSGLSLDSIDALELVVKIEKEFGIKISSSEESRQALASINSLAEFIRARADKSRLPA